MTRIWRSTHTQRICLLRTSLGSCSVVSLRARFTHFTLLHVSKSSGKLTWYRKFDRPPLKKKKKKENLDLQMDEILCISKFLPDAFELQIGSRNCFPCTRQIITTNSRCDFTHFGRVFGSLQNKKMMKRINKICQRIMRCLMQQNAKEKTKTKTFTDCGNWD